MNNGEVNQFTYGATLFEYVSDTNNPSRKQEATEELIRRGFSKKEVETIEQSFKKGGLE